MAERTEITLITPGVSIYEGYCHPRMITTTQELIEHVLSLPPIPTDPMAMLYAAAEATVWIKRVPADYLAITREIVEGSVTNGD